MAKQYRNGGEIDAPVHNHNHDHEHEHGQEGAVASNAALNEELQGQEQSPGGGFLQNLFGGFQEEASSKDRALGQSGLFPGFKPTPEVVECTLKGGDGGL